MTMIERDYGKETALVHEALLPLVGAALQKDHQGLKISTSRHEALSLAFLNRRYRVVVNPFVTNVYIEEIKDIERPVYTIGGHTTHVQDIERGEYLVAIDNEVMKSILARQGQEKASVRKAKEAQAWSDAIQATGW